MAELGKRIDLVIDQPQEHDANRRLVKHLATERQALFTFLEQPGVDATNWRGEQAIRPGVVNRKTSGGNRSDRGAATQGRIMSVLRTAHQQGVDAIALLVGLDPHRRVAQLPRHQVQPDPTRNPEQEVNRTKLTPTKRARKYAIQVLFR